MLTAIQENNSAPRRASGGPISLAKRLAAGALLAVLPVMAVAETATVTECDRQAGYAWLPRIEGAEGIAGDKMDGAAARIACAEAIAANPQDAFLHFLMARAIFAADSSDPKGLEALEKAKESNLAFYYQRLGFYTEKGFGGLDKDAGAALELYVRGCETEADGRVSACHAAANMIRNTAKSAEDHAKVRLYADKGCANGAATACRLMGIYYSDDWDTALPADYKKAENYFDLACKGGNADACGSYGWLFGSKVSTLPRDHGKALEYYAKACDAGATRWCVDAGNLFKDRMITDGPWSTDYAAAEGWYLKGCDAEDARACYQMAMLQQDRLQEETDAEAGGQAGEAAKYLTLYRDFIQKGCELKHSRACSALGSDLSNGLNGFVADGVAAIGHLEAACEARIANACEMGASTLREGRGGLAADPERARYFTDMAKNIYGEQCRNSSSWNCAHLLVMEMDLDPHTDWVLSGDQFDILELGCRDGHFEACNRYSSGLHMRQDLAGTAEGKTRYETALELLRYACAERGGYFCTNLAGDLIFPPVRLGADIQQIQRDEALLLLDAGCRSGDQYACETLDREFAQ